MIRRNVRDWPVMPATCTTCPFSADGDRELRSRIESRLLRVSQMCHHPRQHGHPETHLCRGARDWQIKVMYRLGVIAAPTEAAWNAKRKESQ